MTENTPPAEKRIDYQPTNSDRRAPLMASFDEKPNGGALSVEATLGRKVFEPVRRLEPTLKTVAQDDDQPVPDNAPEDEITRAYLVELRVGFQTWTKSTNQEPFLYCIYATPDCQRFFERRCWIDYGDDGFEIPDDVETYRSIATTKTGNRTLPSTPPGESAEDTRAHYANLLQTRYDIDVEAHRNDTPSNTTEVRA